MKKSLIIFLTAVFVSANAFAGISVTPARNEIQIGKGESFSAFYTIKNDFDKPVDVLITAKNWNNSKENKDVDVSGWLIVSKSAVTLNPREKTEVHYSVKSGDLRGSVSAMISFSVRSPDYEGINLMTSVPVYMTISGTENISFEIDKMEAVAQKAPAGNGQKKISINYSVKNDGNMYIRPSGSVKLLKGENVVFERVIAQQSPVYPDSSRGFFENVDALPKGKYIANITVNALQKSAEKSIQFKVDKRGDVTLQ
jgi:hypothetical protein